MSENPGNLIIIGHENNEKNKYIVGEIHTSSGEASIGYGVVNDSNGGVVSEGEVSVDEINTFEHFPALV